MWWSFPLAQPVARSGSHCFLLLSVVALLLPIVLLLFGTHNPLLLDDGLRHITIAKHYRERGVGGSWALALPARRSSESEGGSPVEGWGDYLFAGYFATHNFDPWFLADLAYVPFTFLPTMTVGLKVATVAFLLFLLACFFPFLCLYRVESTLALLTLLLLLFGSPIFLFRILIGRPFVIMTGLFLLTYFLVLRQRFFFLASVLVLGTLFSHLFIFPLGVAIVGSLWLFFSGQRRSALLCLFAALAGVLLGFLLHPHQAAYASWLITMFLRLPFSKGLGVGAELHSAFGFADIPVFLMGGVLSLLVLALHWRGLLWRSLRERPEIFFTGMLSLLFSIAFMLWVRAVDFLWPLMLLLLLQLVTALPEVRAEAMRVLHRRTSPQGCRWLYLIVLLCFLNLVSVAVPFLKDDPWSSPKEYAAIESVRPGSHVLNVDWQIFPVLLSLNSSVEYARAMDPGLDYYTDPEGFAILDRITERGLWEREARRVDVTQWVKDLREHFDASYLAIVKNDHPTLISKLRTLPTVAVFSESRGLVVFSL